MTPNFLTRFAAAIVLMVFPSAFSRSADASPITLDFESYAHAQVLALNTDLGGVYFDQNLVVYGGNVLPPFLTGKAARNDDTPGGDFSGGFTQTVSSFSLAVGDECCDLDSATLYVYDSGHNLLTSAAFTNMASAQLLSVMAPGIKYFTVDQTGLVDFDNLAFNTEVPEPTSIVSVGVGLAGLLALRRRRQLKG